MRSATALRSDPRTPPSSCAGCSRAAIRDHYDSLALLYRVFWGRHLHHGLFATGLESPGEAQVTLVRHLLNFLPHPPRRVLDVGCGYGATSVLLAKELNCDVTAISVSPRQVQYAARLAQREGVADRARFAVADGEEFSCPAGAFDCIWIVETSEHFFDKPGFFANAARSLAPGGTLVLAAWTAAPELPPDRARQLAVAGVCPGFATAADYATMLESSGLNITDDADLTPAVLPTWMIVCRRVSLARKIAALFPRAARQFADSVDAIAAAFANGELLYHVFAAQQPL